jgi:hypothetical protein
MKIMWRIPVAPTLAIVDLAEQSERAIALLVATKESLPYKPSTGVEKAAEKYFSDFLNHVQAVLEFAKSDLSFLASACTLTRRAFELSIEGVRVLQQNSISVAKDGASPSDTGKAPLGFRGALCPKDCPHKQSTFSRGTDPSCSWERDVDAPTHIEVAAPLVCSDPAFATLQSHELQALHARITAQQRTLPDDWSSESKRGHSALGDWYEVLSVNWEQVRIFGTFFLRYQGAHKKSWITKGDQERFYRSLSRLSRATKRRRSQ